MTYTSDAALVEDRGGRFEARFGSLECWAVLMRRIVLVPVWADGIGSKHGLRTKQLTCMTLQQDETHDMMAKCRGPSQVGSIRCAQRAAMHTSTYLPTTSVFSFTVHDQCYGGGGLGRPAWRHGCPDCFLEELGCTALHRPSVVPALLLETRSIIPCAVNCQRQRCAHAASMLRHTAPCRVHWTVGSARVWYCALSAAAG